MTKSHAIVHSISHPSPIQKNNEITKPTVIWYANPSTWVNIVVMAASASAIGATVGIATYKFSPIELQDNFTKSNNITTYAARFFHFTTATTLILQLTPLNCNTSIDDAILAREHFICGQSKSSILSIIYPNMTLIKNSETYNIKQTESKPKISFNQNELKQISSNEKQNQTFIIIMLDIDDSIDSPIQHWILTINEKDLNRDICSYKKPNIYSSPHRYTFLLYTTSLKNLQISNNLCLQSNKFPLNKIINDNQLKLLGSIYFLLQKTIIPSYIDEK